MAKLILVLELTVVLAIGAALWQQWSTQVSGPTVIIPTARYGLSR